MEKQPYIKIPKYTDSELAMMFEQAVMLQAEAEKEAKFSNWKTVIALASRSTAMSNLIIAQKLLWSK